MVPARQTSKRFSLFLPGDIGFDVPELVFGGLKSGCMRADEDAGVQLVCWLFMTDGVLVKDHVVMVAGEDVHGLIDDHAVDLDRHRTATADGLHSGPLALGAGHILVASRIGSDAFTNHEIHVPVGLEFCRAPLAGFTVTDDELVTVEFV